jgi:hypothetical protein
MAERAGAGEPVGEGFGLASGSVNPVVVQVQQGLKDVGGVAAVFGEQSRVRSGRPGACPPCLADYGGHCVARGGQGEGLQPRIAREGFPASRDRVVAEPSHAGLGSAEEHGGEVGQACRGQRTGVGCAS